MKSLPAPRGSGDGASVPESIRSRTTKLRHATGGRDTMLLIAGAAVALVIAVLLFSRFGSDGTFSRDEAIFAYAGQQQAEGVPFYVSIADQKAPLAPTIAAAGVSVARALGADDLYAMRVAFFVFACLTVVALYLLVARLFESPLAGLIAGATFASFEGFAFEALNGPAAKQPGVFFAVLSMALLASRRSFWGAFAGSLALLVWQPLAVYAAVALATAAITAEADQRWKRFAQACAGASIPLAVTVLYYWLEGALDDLIDSAFVFPVTYLERTDESVWERLQRIVSTVDVYYGGAEVLFWGGLALLLGVFAVRVARCRTNLLAMVRDDAYVTVVIGSLVPVAAFSLWDFQGYPDLYPLLPYAAIGIGAGSGLALTLIERKSPRAVGPVVGAAAVAALVTISWVNYSAGKPGDQYLLRQRADAARLEQLLDAGDTLYALGDPRPLVLTGRRNPSPYILLSGGFDAWVVSRTPGGFDGWTEEILAADPDVIVKAAWRRSSVSSVSSVYERRMRAWLRRRYARIRLGGVTPFVKPEVRARAERLGLLPSPRDEERSGR